MPAWIGLGATYAKASEMGKSAAAYARAVFVALDKGGFLHADLEVR